MRFLCRADDDLMDTDRMLLLQVDLSIDEMDVDILRKCFQQRLENFIVYLLENCGCRISVHIPVRFSLEIMRLWQMKTAAYNLPLFDCCKFHNDNWTRCSSVTERRSLTGELSLACT